MFYNKIMKFFFFLILKILSFQIKIKFRLPKKIDIIVFDREDLVSIEPILKVFRNKLLLDGRYATTKKVYLNFSILKEIKKKIMKEIYLLHIIRR